MAQPVPVPGLIEPDVSLDACAGALSGLNISSPDLCTTLKDSMTSSGIDSYITSQSEPPTEISVDDLPDVLQAALKGCDGNESCNLIAANFDIDTGVITTSNLSGASYGYDTRYTSGNDTAAIIKIQPFTDQFGIPLSVKNQSGVSALATWSTPIILDGGAPLGYTYDDYETFTSGPIAGTDTTQTNSAGCSATCDTNGSCVGFNYNETNDACVLYGTGATKTMLPESLSHAYSKITVPPAGSKQLSDLIIPQTIIQKSDNIFEVVFGPSAEAITSGRAAYALTHFDTASEIWSGLQGRDMKAPDIDNQCGNGWVKLGIWCYTRCEPGMQRGHSETNPLDAFYICYSCGNNNPASSAMYRRACDYTYGYSGPKPMECGTDLAYDSATDSCIPSCGDRLYTSGGKTYCCPVDKPVYMGIGNKCCPADSYLASDWTTCMPNNPTILAPEILQLLGKYVFQTTDRYPILKYTENNFLQYSPTHFNNRHWDDDGKTCADVNACNVSVKRLLNDASVTSFMTNTIKACRGCAGRGAQKQSDGTWYVWYEKALTIFHATVPTYTINGSAWTPTVQYSRRRICDPPYVYKNDRSFVSTYKQPDLYSEPCSHMYSSLYVTGATTAQMHEMVWYNYNSNTYTTSSTPINCAINSGAGTRICPTDGCKPEIKTTGYLVRCPQNGGSACDPLETTTICPTVTTCAVLTGYASGTNLIWYVDGRGTKDWAADKARYGTLAGDKAIESSYSGTYKIFYYDAGKLYQYPNPLMYIYGYGTVDPTVITKPNTDDLSPTPVTWVSVTTRNDGLSYNIYRTYSGITSAGLFAGLNGPYTVSPYRVYYSIRGIVPYTRTSDMRATFPTFILTAMTKPTTEPGSHTCLQNTVLDYGATISQYNTTCVPTCVLNNKDAFAASVAYDGIGKCAVTCRAETGIEKATGSGQCNKVFLSAGMSFAANSNILVRDDVTLEYRNDRLTFKNTMSGHVIFQPEHGSGTDMNGYYVWGSMTSCGFDTDAGVILFKYTMFSISTDGFNTVTSALVTYSTSLPAGAATYKPFTLAITANHNLVIKDRDGVIAWIADEFGGHTDRRTYQDGEDAVGRDPSFVAGVLLDERYGGTPYESLCKDTYVYLYCKESPYSPTMASVSSVAGKCATSGKHCAMGVQSCGGGFNHLGTGGSGKTYVLSSLGQCELPP